MVKNQQPKTTVSSGREAVAPLDSSAFDQESYPAIERLVKTSQTTATARREKRELSEHRMRIGSAWALLILFVAANILTFLGMWKAWQFDSLMLTQIAQNPELRIFKSEVLITLIGATTVQLGIIAVIISKWLFK